MQPTKKNTLHFDLFPTQQEGYNTVNLLKVLCEAQSVSPAEVNDGYFYVLLLFTLSIIGSDLYDTLNSLL